MTEIQLVPLETSDREQFITAFTVHYIEGTGAYKPREHLVQLSGTKPTKEYKEEDLKA